MGIPIRNRLMTEQNSKESGFTLIELLVVILIIGILAAIAIPMFLNQRRAAVDASVKSDASNAAKQIEAWITQQGATEIAIPAFEESDGTPIGDIQLSDGTTMQVRGSTFHYVIRATNTGGNVSSKESPTDGISGIWYDSRLGGIVDYVPTWPALDTESPSSMSGTWVLANP